MFPILVACWLNQTPWPVSPATSHVALVSKCSWLFVWLAGFTGIFSGFFSVRTWPCIQTYKSGLAWISYIPDAPWCWNIYLQNWVIFGVNVGTYSSTMEHLGTIGVDPHFLETPTMEPRTERVPRAPAAEEPTMASSRGRLGLMILFLG